MVGRIQIAPLFFKILYYERWGSVGCLVAADGKTLKNASASAGLEAKCTRLRIRFTHFEGGLPEKIKTQGQVQ